MPPKKSDASKGTTALQPSAAEESITTPVKDKDGLSVEDLSLPRTMVQRLAKSALPANTQIQKDAVLAISKSATVFVNYLSSYANESTQRANKKTIMPNDVFDALKEAEFEAFLPRLEAELAKYNSIQAEKRNKNKQKKESATEGPADFAEPASPTDAAARSKGSSKSATTSSPTTKLAKGTTTSAKGGSGPPATKRAKMASGDAAADEEDDAEDDEEDQDDDAAEEEEEEEEEDDEEEEEGEGEGEDEEDDEQDQERDEDMDRNHAQLDPDQDEDEDEADASD